MQLILTRESLSHITESTMDYTKNGCDVGQDFTEIFGFKLANSMIDLVTFCINQVENQEENNLNQYDNIMKLEGFTDDEEEDEYFIQYFHPNQS